MTPRVEETVAELSAWKVEETVTLPLTERIPPTELEAFDWNPPYRVAKLFTVRVEEAETLPMTRRVPDV